MPGRMPADTVRAHRAQGLTHTLLASYRTFDAKARRRIGGLLLLMAFGAALEAVGAAVIVPFVALINDPTYLSTQEILRELHRSTGYATPEIVIVRCALALFAFFLLKNIFLTLMLREQFRFIYTEMPRFSADLYSKYIARPYVEYIHTNSSVLIRNVSNEVLMFFTNYLIPALTLITELMVLFAMLAVLLWIAPVPTIAAATLLGGLTYAFFFMVRSKVRHYGELQQLHSAEKIKWVSQGLGSVKELKILGRGHFFVERFRQHEAQFSLAARYAMLLNQTPRLFIETAAFSALFLGVALALQFGSTRQAVLPTLALFAVAAARLLPSLNRVLMSITRIAYYRPAAEVVLQARAEVQGTHTEGPIRAQFAMGEWHELVLEDVAYAYPGSPEVLNDINLRIPRGSSLALIGPSGSGKTTLADLTLGLLRPSRGRIRLDDRDISDRVADWQSHTGYIPQTIYLLDDSVRRNVAFGVPDEAIDDEQVWYALRQARLDDVVRSFPDGLSASIGENGGRLSGGQRQRLGIARALYSDPEFIVMDEATSALDETTEREIADTFASLVGRRTLLVIAHRPEIIGRCQFKYSIQERNFVS
jgi:ATP-binding cassette, subfamily B, bacterial PglK